MPDINVAELYERIGSFGQAIENHGRTMERFGEKIDDMRESVNAVKSDFAVMLKESSIKREGCNMLFEKHSKSIQELDARTVRDNKHIQALENAPAIEKAANKKSKAWIAVVSGAVLFVLGAAEILWVLFHSGAVK